MKSGCIDNSRNVVSFADLRRDAIMIEVGATSMPVASIEHLIVMKTGTGCNKDLIDIEELLKIQALKMTTAQRNLLLLQEIEANRKFLLMAYAQNPRLLKHAEERIKQLFDQPMLQDINRSQTENES